MEWVAIGGKTGGQIGGWDGKVVRAGGTAGGQTGGKASGRAQNNITRIGAREMARARTMAVARGWTMARAMGWIVITVQVVVGGRPRSRQVIRSQTRPRRSPTQPHADASFSSPAHGKGK